MPISFGKNTDKVMKYIQACIDLTDKGKTGIVLTGQNIFEFERSLFVLGRLINISSFSSNSALKRNIIKRAIGIVKDSGKITPSMVLKILEIERNNILETEHKKFIIAFQFIIREKYFSRKQITVDGIKFKVASKYNFFKNFENPAKAMIGYTDVSDSLKKNYLILYTDYLAPNYEMAFEEVKSRFEVMRGLLNLALKYHKIMLFHIGRPTPNAVVRPPKFFLIYSDQKKLQTFYYTLEQYIEPELTLEKNRLDFFYKLIRQYNQKKDSPIKRVFEDTVKLYVSSLDSYDGKYALLHLWQVLEILTLKDVENISEKKVCQRVKSIYNYDTLVSDIIDSLYEKRNSMVHGSIDVSIDDTDLQLLREIVEELILFLFNHINSIDSRQKLNYFYENIPLGTIQLEEKLETINYVKKLKNH